MLTLFKHAFLLSTCTNPYIQRYVHCLTLDTGRKQYKMAPLPIKLDRSRNFAQQTPTSKRGTSFRAYNQRRLGTTVQHQMQPMLVIIQPFLLPKRDRHYLAHDRWQPGEPIVSKENPR